MLGRLLVVGEALIDAVETAAGVAEFVGGSPANVAFGLGALGHDVELATWIGPDARGRRIVERCAQVGVCMVEGSIGAAATSVAHASLNERGEARYRFDLSWSVPALAGLAAATHVHTGSLAATTEPGGSQVLETVRAARPHATISYDPNVRPSLMGAVDDVRDRVEQLVALADVVKASDEDIAWLYDGVGLTQVLRRWGELGSALAVVTHGPGGATFALHHLGEQACCPAPALHVVDSVGAGDSFMAGLLSGLLDGGLLGGAAQRQALRGAGTSDVRPALERAVATAAVTVSTAGAYAPSRTEICRPDGAGR